MCCVHYIWCLLVIIAILMTITILQNSFHCSAKETVKAVKKRIKHKKPAVQLLGLAVSGLSFTD